MSADEDTELRDLVAQTLESNGVLGKIRAELRASVFLALEEQESVKNKTPFQNQDLKNYLNTKDGRLAGHLVREFLEFFNLDFTLSVFDPETGLSQFDTNRECLAQDLNILESDGPPSAPLLAEVLRRGCQGEKLTRKITEIGDREESAVIPKDLSKQQIADAKAKFEQYDTDGSGTIEKDELRGLFNDIFPSFNKNMLDRYVNDEFRAVDKDFSNSIDFDEFLGMYKRLFLLCRTVVSGDVEDLVSQKSLRTDIFSPRSHSESKNKSLSFSTEDKSSKHVDKADTKGALKQNTLDLMGSDIEEDPFQDDSVSINNTDHKRMNGDPFSKPVNSVGDYEKSSSHSKSAKSSSHGYSAVNQDRSRGKDSSEDRLRSVDKRMAGLDLDGHDDFEYEDDFNSEEGHSLSLKSPRTNPKSLNENGSVAEEIDEELEEFSIEADDLLRSERSGFDDLTTDRTISQQDNGFDYVEDVQLN